MNPNVATLTVTVRRLAMPPSIPRGILTLVSAAGLLFTRTSWSQGAPAATQTSPASAASQKTPDYSHEPFIVESLATRARFENDGTGRIETTARIRVQTDAGIQAFGQLVFPYNAITERLEIYYVRVERADGTKVEATLATAQDAPPQAVRDAPLYNGPREKTVTVPALHSGDVLSYQSAEIISQPLAPGQFWYEYRFEKTAITREQRFELDVPSGRVLKLKAQPGFDPSDTNATEDAGRHVYYWSKSHLRHEDDSAAPAKTGDDPDVRISTFTSWDEIAAWYQALERGPAAPAPEIQQKAEALTAGRTTALEKLEAIYDFVGPGIRYVNLPFGAGHVEPHKATAILKNAYGDSIDKHTLLAALAAAVGIKADAVLLHTQRSLDADFPSPAAIDHVLSRVRFGSDEVWLDTTTEVAPFRFLPSVLRHRKALAVPPDGPPSFVSTPADPPLAVRQVWRLEGTIGALGKLDARVHYTLGGDNELLLRLAFRRTPKEKWKELATAIAAADGFRGEVDSITPGDSADTHHRFTLEYHVVQPAFLDWTKRRIELKLPIPPLALPEETQRAGESIELGSPAGAVLEMKLALPEKYAAHAPAAVSIEREYGGYRSAYSVEGPLLTATRSLNITRREVPADEARDYALFFRRAVRNDEAQTCLLEEAGSGAPEIPDTASAADLAQAATRAYSARQFALAEQLLERAVALDPEQKTSWKLLGAVRLAQQKNEAAAEAFRKQIALDPQDEFAYEGLGLAQAAQKQYDAAIASFRKQLEVKPLDPVAQASLGTTLIEARRYPEASKELEKAVALSPNDPRLYIALGRAETGQDRGDKARAAFEKAVELSPTPPVWNAVAAELAAHGASLERAQQYAESAVAATTADLNALDLEKLSPRDLARVAALGSYWDTLGWVLFQRGDVKRARDYADAAWRLNGRAEAAEHLARINEKLGGANSGATQLKYELGRILPEGTAGAADFFLLFSPAAKTPAAVKFVSGDAGLRGAAEKLRAMDYGRMFPVEGPGKLVRRGTLACPAGKEACVLALIPAGDVRSLE